MYALIGFDVTPATVIGVLTILGYSLYDTVVVFDKVQENTRGITGVATRYTYSEAANLAVNQTLIRSINTTLIALLPVGGRSCSSAPSCSAPGTLKDLSLALFVGIAVGAYSSIFIATPLLADLQGARAGYAGAAPPGARQARADRRRQPRKPWRSPPPLGVAAGADRQPAATERSGCIRPSRTGRRRVRRWPRAAR